MVTRGLLNKQNMFHLHWGLINLCHGYNYKHKGRALLDNLDTQVPTAYNLKSTNQHFLRNESAASAVMCTPELRDVGHMAGPR